MPKTRFQKFKESASDTWDRTKRLGGAIGGAMNTKTGRTVIGAGLVALGTFATGGLLAVGLLAVGGGTLLYTHRKPIWNVLSKHPGKTASVGAALCAASLLFPPLILLGLPMVALGGASYVGQKIFGSVIEFGSNVFAGTFGQRKQKRPSSPSENMQNQQQQQQQQQNPASKQSTADVGSENMDSIKTAYQKENYINFEKSAKDLGNGKTQFTFPNTDARDKFLQGLADKGVQFKAEDGNGKPLNYPPKTATNPNATTVGSGTSHKTTANDLREAVGNMPSPSKEIGGSSGHTEMGESKKPKT